MADDQKIDTLTVEINSDATQADKSIRRLVDSLIRLASSTGQSFKNLRTVAGDIKSLNNATKGLDTSKLSAYASGMDSLSVSIGRFADIGDKIEPAVDVLSRLAGLDLTRMRVSGDFSGLSSLADGAEKLAAVAPKLAALKASDLNRSLTAFQKLGQTDFSGVAQSLQVLNGLDVSGFSGLVQALGTFAGSAEKLAALGRKDMNAAIRNIEKLGAINFGGLAKGAASLVGVDFSQLAALGQAFGAFSGSLAGADKIASETIRILSSLGQLAASAQNIPLIITNLPALSDELNKFISIMSSAPAVANGTTVLVSALAQLSSSGARIQNVAIALPEIGVGIRALIDSMASAPVVNESVIRLIESLSRLTAQGGRAGAAAGNLHGNFNLLSGSASKLHISISKVTNGLKGFTRQLLSLAGLGTGLYALVKVGRESIKTFSDLIEIQNVVDKSFGDMAYKIEELAKVSVPDFGMSELTLKQIASRYQAMGVAMGFTQGQMSDMSIELTKLAADMASFYNVEQEAVAESLESIFTGTTRPLRTYGLDLTQATLQEWAMKQGLDANIKSMSQMEKTMLRFQYVMTQTKSISGDFKDTQLTMANQVRILRQSFEQLASVIGGALVNAFKPFIVNLNRAMQSIIAFAQTVVNALGKIFGWTYEIKNGGISNDFEDAGDAAEDMADGTGAAKDNLEEMQKYIAAWHEVNNMTTKDDDDGGGGAGGGGAGGAAGGALAGQLVHTEGLLDKYKSDIDSLYELGEYIGKVLTDAMNRINWDKVYEGARNFGKGLADFLNGLISPELFGAVGRTIAGALNTAIYAALAFGERFDWKDFGLSIATGINEFFKMFDFASLAKTINVWVNGILDAIITAIDNTDWGMIGTKIGTFLEKIDFLKILGKIGKAIWKALNAGFEMYQKTFETAPLETALISLIGVTKLLKVAKFQALINVFSKGFTVIGAFFNALSQGNGVLGSLMITFPKVGSAVKVLNDSLLYLKMGFADGQFLNGLKYAFQNISENLTTVQKGFIGITAAFAEFAIFKNVTRDMALGTENMVSGLVKLAATAGIAGVALSAVFSFPVGAIAAGIIGLTGLIMGMSEVQNELAENSSIGQFSNSIDELSENIASKTESIRENIAGMKENIESSGAAQTQMAKDLAAEYAELSEKTGLTVNEQIRLKEISEQLAGIVPGLSDYINDQTGLLEIQKDTLDDLIENMDLYAKKQAAQEALVEAYKAQYEAAVNVQKAEEGISEAAADFIKANDGMSEAVKNMVQEGDIEGLKNLRQELWEGTSEFGSLKEAFGEGAKNIGTVDKMIESLEQSMGGYTEALSDANEVLADSEKLIEIANDKYMESARSISENEARMVENTKATAEYQQKLRDISGELSNFGVVFSEEFKEKLALDDTDMVNSVVEAFSKMNQQVQLSSGELQQLFSNIAPGISSNFINALSNQEPAIQAQVAATMANISSGAQVSSDEVKNVFSVIGYELPQETINSFLSQSAPLQSSVIDLLSSVANGSSLVSENLYALFHGLGIGLPNELIETLGGPDVSAETQQAAINLLSQLAAGCDMSSEEISQRFVELGLEIPAVLQDAIDSGTTQTYLKAQGLLDQLSSAASEEERQRIVSEYNSLGQGVLDEGIIKALGDENGEVRSAAVAIINQISSATTGEEKEAAISAANSFATEYIGEISGTMTAQADSKLPEVGKHIVGGVISGMTDDSGELGTAAEAVMGRVEGDLRKAGRIHSPSERMMPIGSYLLQGIIEGFTSSIGQWTSSIYNWASETYNTFQAKIGETITGATTWFSELPEKIYTAIFPSIERVTTWGSEMFQTFQTNVNNSITGVVSWFSQMPSKIYNAIITFVTQTLPQWKGNIDNFFGNAIPNVISNVVHLFGDIGRRLVPIGENIIRGLWEGISNLTGWIGDKIGGFCSNILNKFRAGFDEHSPSKEAFKIGDYFTLGLQNGLVDRFSDVYGDVESFTKNLSSIKVKAPVPDYTIPVVEEYSRQYSESDMGRLKSTLQMEMDEKMAQMAYENRQLRDAVEQNTQILEKILSQGIVLNDNEFTKRYESAASKFYKQHRYEMGLYPAGR